MNSLDRLTHAQLKLLLLYIKKKKRRTDAGRITISLSHGENNEYFYITYHEIFLHLCFHSSLHVMSFTHNSNYQNLTQSLRPSLH